MATLRILFACCLLLLGSPGSIHAGFKAAAAPEEIIADGLVLLSAVFGIMEKGEDGRITVKPTDTIPLVEGQSYGWSLRFRSTRGLVAVREEFELPVAPKTWSSPLQGQGFTVSPDGRTGITEGDALLTKEGILRHGWGVAKGDPAGDHIVRLYIEGKLVRTFKFKFVEPK